MAAVFVEPVQNAGGCFPPPPGYFERLREICTRHDVLLVSDEVICAFGRIGSMFACDDFGYVPDIITCAKGMTSGYSPLGAMIASDRVFEPFATGTASFLHGYTFGGHPVSAAVGLANLDIFEREGINAHVREQSPAFRATLEKLLDLPIVGDVRGEGFFFGIELVKDKATKETFDDEESERLLRGFLSKALWEAGLYCRTDDRGDPVIQLAPPLIARTGRVRGDGADPARGVDRGMGAAVSGALAGVLWMDQVVADGDDLAPRPPLDGDAEVDVAIVGAGFTGLWTAYHLLRGDPGLRVLVVERQVAGFGASGRNGGWCSALFPASEASAGPSARPRGARWRWARRCATPSTRSARRSPRRASPATG